MQAKSARSCITVFVSLLTSLLCAFAVAQPRPHFELDRDWPRVPLAGNWLTGGLGGLCIDANDHVYLLNRQNVVLADLDAAELAPPVIALQPDGSLFNSWGHPEFSRQRLHDCHVDAAGDIWIVPAATGEIRKYSATGRLLMQIGESGRYDSSDGTREGEPLNSDSGRLFLPAAVAVHEPSGDVYVADGELPGGNSRIAVFDSDGEFLRQWSLPRAPSEADIIALPHCLRLSGDERVYVCDRRTDRIQVFDLQGNLVQSIETTFAPVTPPEGRDSGERGSAVVLAFSADAGQRFLYVVNQNSVAVDILERDSGRKVGSFGLGPGRYPGQFELPHGIAVDSQGNVYVAEQEGRRVQRFKLVGPSPL